MSDLIVDAVSPSTVTPVPRIEEVWVGWTECQRAGLTELLTPITHSGVALSLSPGKTWHLSLLDEFFHLLAPPSMPGAQSSSSGASARAVPGASLWEGLVCPLSSRLRLSVSDPSHDTAPRGGGGAERGGGGEWEGLGVCRTRQTRLVVARTATAERGGAVFPGLSQKDKTGSVATVPRDCSTRRPGASSGCSPSSGMKGQVQIRPHRCSE